MSRRLLPRSSASPSLLLPRVAGSRRSHCRPPWHNLHRRAPPIFSSPLRRQRYEASPVFAILPGGSVVSSGCSKRRVDAVSLLALPPVESPRWRQVRAPARVARGVAALLLGPWVMTLGPPQQATVAFGLAGLASGPLEFRPSGHLIPLSFPNRFKLQQLFKNLCKIHCKSDKCEMNFVE
jgi:hypothetical protein